MDLVETIWRELQIVYTAMAEIKPLEVFTHLVSELVKSLLIVAVIFCKQIWMFFSRILNPSLPIDTYGMHHLYRTDGDIVELQIYLRRGFLRKDRCIFSSPYITHRIPHGTIRRVGNIISLEFQEHVGFPFLITLWRYGPIEVSTISPGVLCGVNSRGNQYCAKVVASKQPLASQSVIDFLGQDSTIELGDSEVAKIRQIIRTAPKTT
jgi:hypothetical protein